MEWKEKYMQSVSQKNNVSIDITRHIKTFINPNNGEEITREQLRDKIDTDNTSENREQTEVAEDSGTGKVEENS